MAKVFKRFPLKGSLRNKLLGWFLLIAILPLVASAAIGYATMKTEAENTAKRELRTIAESVSQTINEFMNERVSDVMVWADLRLIKEALEVAEVREDASETMREMVKLYGSFEDIALLDSKGNCVASSWPKAVGMDFSSSESFKGAKAGKIYIADFHQDPRVEEIDSASKGWTLTISAPVKVGGNVTGVVMTNLKWAPLEQMIAGITIAHTGYVFVTNQKRQAILHKERSVVYGLPIAGEKINLVALDKAIQAKEASAVYTWRNEDTIAGIYYPRDYLNFPGLGWAVAARAPKAEVADITRLIYTLFAFGAAILVLVVILAIFVAAGIAKPIRELADTMTKVGQNLNLTLRVPVKTGDETGQAADTFNKLLARLQESFSAVLEAVSRVRQSSSTVSDVTQNIVVNATAQAERARTVLDRVSAMGETAQEVSKNAGETLRSSTQTQNSFK